MGASVCARIAITFLFISATSAVPAITRKTAEVGASDLTAESSEVVAESVAPPADLRPEVADSDTYAAPSEDHSIELVGGAQNFFPSFANLFEPREPRQQSSFRLPTFGNQETAYSQRPSSYRSLLNYPLFGGFGRNFDSFSKPEQQSAPLVDASSSVLGSGNFGIIKGGTFNTQNDEDSEYEGFNSFYNNGHGRPSLGVGYIANPRPNYNQDQFANFRDFADINTPANSAYSHFVVVYANKNSTMDEISEETKKVVSKPKNIFETLESLEETKQVVSKPKNIFETLESLEEKAPPKISKSKAKLEKTKLKALNKKEQWKKAKLFSQKHDMDEPLLALS